MDLATSFVRFANARFRAASSIAVAAAAAALMAAPMTSVAVDTSAVRIDIGAEGRVINDIGFDLKQPGVAARLIQPNAAGQPEATPYARALFSDRRFTVLRIPIFASNQQGKGKPARAIINSNGTLNYENSRADTAYGDVIDAVRVVRQLQPGMKVFASLRTVDCEGGNHRTDPECQEFNGAFKQNGAIAPAAYGQFLGRYLQFMKASGVDVDFIGPDNEGRGDPACPAESGADWPARECVGTNNEGRISVADVKIIRTAMASQLSGTGIGVPGIIFNDGMEPDNRTICGAASDDALWNVVFAKGMHYQAKNRHHRVAGQSQFARLDALVGCRPNFPTWDTELHYDQDMGIAPSPNSTNAQLIVRGGFQDGIMYMKGVADHFDAGVRGIVYWAYAGRRFNCSAPATGDAINNCALSMLQESLHQTLAGATTSGHIGGRVLPSTGFGSAAAPIARGGTPTRAVRVGNDVAVWIINDTGDEFAAKPMDLIRANGSSVTYTPEQAQALEVRRWSRQPETPDGMVGMRYEGVVAGATSVGSNDLPRVEVPPYTITQVWFRDIL